MLKMDSEARKSLLQGDLLLHITQLPDNLNEHHKLFQLRNHPHLGSTETRFLPIFFIVFQLE
jgi:hypothetical protein